MGGAEGEGRLESIHEQSNRVQDTQDPQAMEWSTQSCLRQRRNASNLQSAILSACVIQYPKYL